MALKHEGGAVGLGLRGPHIDEVLATRPRTGWFEVHPENYLADGWACRRLEAVRRDYPVSFHGVGLSLGSAEGVSEHHLARIAALVGAMEPCRFSEHLSWSATGGTYFNDLLPLPYTEEALAAVCRNIDRVQEALGRRILVENPSSYLRFAHSTIAEPDFLNETARRTGCLLLCDVNNVYVTCRNFGLDPAAYLAAIRPDRVGEIHLAGHFATERDGRTLLIDDHGARVAPPVWELHAQAVRRFPGVPTLIEWDRNLPDFAVLMEEARRAEAVAAGALEEAGHAIAC